MTDDVGIGDVTARATDRTHAVSAKEAAAGGAGEGGPAASTMDDDALDDASIVSNGGGAATAFASYSSAGKLKERNNLLGLHTHARN